MRGARVIIAAATALTLAAGVARAQDGRVDWAERADASQVVVRHAAARLVVIAEPRRDISVSIQHGRNRLPPLAVRREAGRIVVEGGLDQPFGGQRIDCRGAITTTTTNLPDHSSTSVRDQRSVVVGGYGQTAVGDLPVITAHVPLDVRVAGDGAVYGEVGAARSLAIAGAGCGDWTLGPVSGRLDVAMSGSGDVRGANVGSARVVASGSSDVMLDRVSGAVDAVLGGSGDLHAGAIMGPLQVRLSGSGDVTAGYIEGPVRADIAGSGDVRLRSGRAPSVAAHVSGSGEFDFGGEAGQVDAVASGSGDIHIAHASGPVSRISRGSGEVTVGR